MVEEYLISEGKVLTVNSNEKVAPFLLVMAGEFVNRTRSQWVGLVFNRRDSSN
jgi:hypothetical protein